MREIKIHTQFEQLSIGKVFDDIDHAKKKGYTSDEELYENGLLLTYETSNVLMTYEVRMNSKGLLKMELKKSERKQNG